MDIESLRVLLMELLKIKDEAEWLEFKLNNSDPKAIGEYISALSNSAALNERDEGWLIWGVENETWKPVGTTFQPSRVKIHHEELLNWLIRQLNPPHEIQFYEFEYESVPIVMLKIPAARSIPTSFNGEEFTRIGSHKQRLKKFPERERALWRIFDKQPFESLTVLSNQTPDQLLGILDYSAYYRMLGQGIPSERRLIIETFEKEGLIRQEAGERYSITALGAILFARTIEDFPLLRRKSVRVIVYKGQDRTETLREIPHSEGYAAGFERLIENVKSQIPAREQIKSSLREVVFAYPEIALRELIPNALIHQDFFISGSGPLIEIFSDRIEISNPGPPLVDTLRFIDTPPISRNERLAGLMRRMNVCEERGSGIDKAITAIERVQLPPPDFLVYENFTRVILFGPKIFAKMSKSERIRASYQHACLCYVENNRMTNTSLRDRFGLAPKDISIVSRIIAETIRAGCIKPEDPSSTSRRHIRYVPFWAI